jgi:excisionase family DNA binding protein
VRETRTVSDGIHIALPPEVIETIVSKVIEELDARGPLDVDPLLDVAETAQYLRAKPQRIYDLHSARKIFAVRDGTRLLFRRSELDRYLEGRGVVTSAGSPSVATPSQARSATEDRGRRAASKAGGHHR